MNMKRTMKRFCAILVILAVLPGCGGGPLGMSDTGGQDNGSDGGGASTEPLAYVLFGGPTGDFGVTAISTATHTIVTTIDTGGFLGFDVAVTPDGRTAYVVGVAPRGGGQALAISTATNQIVETIDLGPQGTNGAFVVITPDGEFAHVVHEGQTGGVWTISTATNTVVSSVEIGLAARDPEDVELTPDGAFLYLVDGGVGGGNLIVLSTSDNDVSFVETGNQNNPVLAMSPDGRSVYTTGGFPEVLSVVSTATNTIADTVEFERLFGTRAILPSPDGASVYVLATDGSSPEGSLQVISNVTNTIDTEVDIGRQLAAVIEAVIGPEGEFIYYTDVGENEVQVISTATNSIVESVGVGIGPQYMAFTPDGAFLYVTNQLSNSVSVISTADHSVVATVNHIGDVPSRLAIMP